jgi:hypothetical protein
MDVMACRVLLALGVHGESSPLLAQAQHMLKALWRPDGRGSLASARVLGSNSSASLTFVEPGSGSLLSLGAMRSAVDFQASMCLEHSLVAATTQEPSETGSGMVTVTMYGTPVLYSSSPGEFGPVVGIGFDHCRVNAASPSDFRNLRCDEVIGDPGVSPCMLVAQSADGKFFAYNIGKLLVAGTRTTCQVSQVTSTGSFHLLTAGGSTCALARQSDPADQGWVIAGAVIGSLAAIGCVGMAFAFVSCGSRPEKGEVVNPQAGKSATASLQSVETVSVQVSPRAGEGRSSVRSPARA